MCFKPTWSRTSGRRDRSASHSRTARSRRCRSAAPQRPPRDAHPADHRHIMLHFVVADDALLAAALQGLVDQFRLPIGQRRASRLHTCNSLAGLRQNARPRTAHRRFRLDAAVLARAPADISPARSPIANGPIGMPTWSRPRRPAAATRLRTTFSDCLPRCQHAVAETLSQTPITAAPLRFSRDSNGRGQRRRGLGGAHDLAQLHHIAGEKCMPSTSCGRFVTFAISLMLSTRCWKPAPPGWCICPAPRTLPSDRHGLEHRFDHQVSVLDVFRPTTPVIRPMRLAGASRIPPRAAVAS